MLAGEGQVADGHVHVRAVPEVLNRSGSSAGPWCHCEFAVVGEQRRAGVRARRTGS